MTYRVAVHDPKGEVKASTRGEFVELRDAIDAAKQVVSRFESLELENYTVEVADVSTGDVMWSREKVTEYRD